MTIKQDNKTSLFLRMWAKLKGYLHHFLSSPCCDIFPGDVWTSASRSHSAPAPLHKWGQRWTDAAWR